MTTKAQLVAAKREHVVSEENLSTKREQKKAVDDLVVQWGQTRKVSFWSGLGLVIVGSALWYLKVQRPQDAIMRDKARSRQG